MCVISTPITHVSVSNTTAHYKVVGLSEKWLIPGQWQGGSKVRLKHLAMPENMEIKKKKDGGMAPWPNLRQF